MKVRTVYPRELNQHYEDGEVEDVIIFAWKFNRNYYFPYII